MRSALLAAVLSMLLNIFISVLISPATPQSDPDVKKVVNMPTSHGVHLLIQQLLLQGYFTLALRSR
jgi:hypothetical protein